MGWYLRGLCDGKSQDYRSDTSGDTCQFHRQEKLNNPWPNGLPNRILWPSVKKSESYLPCSCCGQLHLALLLVRPRHAPLARDGHTPPT